jgi:hypothetical protein
VHADYIPVNLAIWNKNKKKKNYWYVGICCSPLLGKSITGSSNPLVHAADSIPVDQTIWNNNNLYKNNWTYVRVHCAPLVVGKSLVCVLFWCMYANSFPTKQTINDGTTATRTNCTAVRELFVQLHGKSLVYRFCSCQPNNTMKQQRQELTALLWFCVKCLVSCVRICYEIPVGF